MLERPPSESSRTDPQPIDHSYLLVTHIPSYVDEDGGIWLNRLWHRDFVRHLTYLRRLTLASPKYPISSAVRSDVVRVDVPPGSELRFEALPGQDTKRHALKRLPATAAALWRAVGSAGIVHAGMVGWPYPVGWLASLFSVIRRKPLVIIVESVPWRLVDGEDRGRRARVWSALCEAAARWCVNHASISFYTQPSYRATLLTRARGPCFIAPASWIDEEDILDDEAAGRAWKEKGQRERRRFLFAGRLVREKGVGTLLAAIGILSGRGVPVDIDIIGAGPLFGGCAAAAERYDIPKVRLMEPVAAGAAFLAILGTYDAVLIPSLSDEQPRILFDAYARAVPVIAANTDGLRQHVNPETTGWLTPPGDAAALADAMEEAASTRAGLERRGLAALEVARATTHRRMHLDRWRHLIEQFGPGSA